MADFIVSPPPSDLARPVGNQTAGADRFRRCSPLSRDLRTGSKLPRKFTGKMEKNLNSLSSADADSSRSRCGCQGSQQQFPKGRREFRDTSLGIGLWENSFGPDPPSHRREGVGEGPAGLA